MFGDLAEINVLRQRHSTGVNSQDLQTGLTVGNANFDLAVETARAAERGVENLGDVGGADDDDLAASHKAIHQAKKLGHDPLFDFACNFSALGSYSIDFVDKEDGGRMPRSFLENLAQLGLALAVKLPHDLGTVEVNEVHPALGSDCACQQSFSRAWRAI